jgi:RimJ/RimL family protein N-acetyltransferase
MRVEAIIEKSALNLTGLVKLLEKGSCVASTGFKAEIDGAIEIGFPEFLYVPFQFRNKGYGTLAVKEALSVALELMRSVKIVPVRSFIETSRENIPMQKIAISLGYTLEENYEEPLIYSLLIT